MATKNTDLRNKMATDFGTIFNSGTLEIWDDSGTPVKLATFTLPATAFGSPSTGVITMNAVSPATAVAGGTAATGRLKSSTTHEITGLTVGVGAPSAYHITIDDAVIVNGQAINLVSFTWTEGANIAAPA